VTRDLRKISKIVYTSSLSWQNLSRERESCVE
jgi:hypothetical protein